MPVTVRVPTILRTYTGGAAEVTLESPGPTLSTALASLEDTAPGIRTRILDDSGAMRRFVNIYVNDEDVRFSGGLDTQLEDGASIAVIPAVAGG